MMRFFGKTLFIGGLFLLLFLGSSSLLTSAQTANTSCPAGQFWLQCGASGGCAPTGSVCPATTNTGSTSGSSCPAGQVQCQAMGTSPAGCYATCPTASSTDSHGCTSPKWWCMSKSTCVTTASECDSGGTTATSCPAGQVQCPAMGTSPVGCYTTCPTASGTGSTGSLQCTSPQIKCWNGSADYCYSPTAAQPSCPMNCGTGMKKMNCPDASGKTYDMCVSESNPVCPTMTGTGSTGTGSTTSCQSPMVSCPAAGSMPAGCYEKCAPTTACSNGSWWWDSNNHDWKCGTTGTGGTGTGTMTEEQRKTECAKWTDMKWCPSTDAAMQGMCVKNTDVCCTSGQKFCWDDTQKKNYCYTPSAAQPSCPASTGTGDTTSEWDKCKTTGGSWCPAGTTYKAYCAPKGSKCECPSGMTWDEQSMTCKASQTQTCSDDSFWCPWSMSGSGGECKKNGSACWTYNPPTCGKGYTACKNNDHGSYECYAGTSCPDLSTTTPEQRCKAKNAAGENRWQWCPHKNYGGAGGSDGNCADTSDKCMMPCNQQMCEARSKEKGNESMEWCSDTYKMWDGKTETSEWCSPSGCPVKKEALCLGKGREWCKMEGDMPAMMSDSDQENGWCAMKNETCPFNWPYRKDTCEKYQGKWCQYDRNWGECVPGNRTCDEFDFSPGKCMWGKNAAGNCNPFPDTQSKCESPEAKGYWCKPTMNYMPVMCGPQPMTATAMPAMPQGWCNKLPMCPNKPEDGMRICPDGKKYAISKLSECPSIATVEEPKKEKQCPGGKQALSDGTCPVEKRKLEEPEKLKPEEVLTPEERASRESDRSSILKDLEDAAAGLRGKRDGEGYSSAMKAVNELKGYQEKLHTFTKAVVDSYKEVVKILKARGAKIEKDGSVDTAQKLLEDLKVGQLNKIKLDFVDTEKFLDTLEEKIATLKDAGLNVSGILESLTKESRKSLESVISASSYSDDVQKQSDALAANLSTINKRYLPTINISFKVKNAAELLGERLATLAEEAAALKESLSEKKYDVTANIAAINSQITKAKSELAKNMKSTIGSSTLSFLKTFTESRFRDIEDELADTGSIEDLSLLLYGDDGKEDAIGGVAGRFASYASKAAAMKASEKNLKGKQRSAALRTRTTLETEIKRAKTPYNQLKSLEKKEDTLNQKQRVSVVKTVNELNGLLDRLDSKLKLQNEASVFGALEDILEKDEIEPADVKEVKESIKASKDISQLLGFGTSRRYIVRQ